MRLQEMIIFLRAKKGGSMSIITRISAGAFLKTMRLKANDGLKIIQKKDEDEELSNEDQKKLIKIIDDCRNNMQSFDLFQNHK